MTLVLEVQPDRPLLDEELSLCVSGLLPGREVIPRAEMREYHDRCWTSDAAFEADTAASADSWTRSLAIFAEP
jgi:hypothetical protein